MRGRRFIQNRGSGGLMKKNILGRLILIGVTIVLALIFFLPNLPVWDSMPQWWKEGMPNKGIVLGLDLQGGLHLVYEVQVDEAVDITVDRIVGGLKAEASDKGIDANISRDEWTIIIDPPSSELDAVVEKRYWVLDDEGNGKYSLPSDEIDNIRENSVRQALETIRNRIDQFGVAEPNIHRQGQYEIVVELPGVKDPDRAIELIGQTAQLVFKIVDGDSPVALEMPASIEVGGEDAFLEQFRDKIPEGDEVLFEKLIDPETRQTVGMRPYLLKKEVLISGDLLSEARVSIDTRYNEPYVSLTFNAAGAKAFEEVTGEHVQENMAIILDNNVYSAPVIRERIAGGSAQISGNFTMEEAQDLSIVLRAGALPATLKMLQNVTVGPSLGRDSIEAGKQAGLIGAVLVVIFMLIYYRLSGLIADFALLLNIFLLLGGMAALNATLTLPGIAGVILAIGMAVDSNVLMFERMREELRAGKTPRAAVDSGYDKAFWTIFDSHVTTLITALVLFQFGTGPIKGFAVTLSMGVAINLFTALIGTKTIFDLVNSRREVRKLSI